MAKTKTLARQLTSKRMSSTSLPIQNTELYTHRYCKYYKKKENKTNTYLCAREASSSPSDAAVDREAKHVHVYTRRTTTHLQIYTQA